METGHTIDASVADPAGCILNTIVQRGLPHEKTRHSSRYFSSKRGNTSREGKERANRQSVRNLSPLDYLLTFSKKLKKNIRQP